MTARLGVLVVLLTLGAAAGFGLLALREGERAADLAAAQAAAGQADGIYAAAGAAARERDLAYIAMGLEPEKAGALRPHIAGARAAAELPAGLRAVADGAAETVALDAVSERIRTLRPQVDAALALPRNDATADLSRRWMAAGTAHAESLLHLAEAVAGGPAEAGWPGHRLRQARHAAVWLAERMGYERALLAAGAASGRVLPEAAEQERALAASGMAFALQRLGVARVSGELSAPAAEAIAQAEQRMTGIYDPLRRGMTAAAQRSAAYPAGPELWLERADQALEAVDRTSAALGRAAAERVAAARSAGRGDAAIHGVLAITALVLGLLALLSRAPARLPSAQVAQALPAPTEPSAPDDRVGGLLADADAAMAALETRARETCDAIAAAAGHVRNAGLAVGPAGAAAASLAAAVERASAPVSNSVGGAWQAREIAAGVAALRAVGEQARLFGLNAAIEATRAAEAGRAVPPLAAGARGLAERIATLVDRLDGALAAGTDPVSPGGAVQDLAAAANLAELASGAGTRIAEIADGIAAAEAETQQAARAGDGLRAAADAVADRLQSLRRHLDAG